MTATLPVNALVWHVDDWKRIAEEHPMIGYRLAVFAGQVLFARVANLRAQLIDDMSFGIE